MEIIIVNMRERMLRAVLRAQREGECGIFVKPSIAVCDDFYQIRPLIKDLNFGYKFNFFKGIDSSVWADIMLLCEVC